MKKTTFLAIILSCSLYGKAQIDTLIPARMDQTFAFTSTTHGLLETSGKFFFGNPFQLTTESTGGFGQIYTVANSNTKVTGVLFWLGKKNTETGTLTAKIQSLDGPGYPYVATWPPANPMPTTGMPGTVLGTATKLLSDCDSAFTTWTQGAAFPIRKFEKILFSSPISVPIGRFAVTLNYPTATTGNFGVCSTVWGTKPQVNDDALVYATLTNVGTAGTPYWWSAKYYDSQERSIDVCLFPVITTVTGINDFAGMNGIQSKIFPNPAKENTTISYTLKDKASKVIVNIIDEKGRIVKTIVEGSKEPGSYELLIKLSNLAVGTYYCTIEADSNRLAMMLNIVK